MALTNCSECGRLFNKIAYDICPLCEKEVERDYEIVYQFLRDYGPAHIDIIHEHTKVDKKRIMKFIADDRFDFVKVTYKCERCGQAISSGRMCEKCLAQLNKEISELQKNEPPPQQQKQTEKERWTSLDRYYREK